MKTIAKITGLFLLALSCVVFLLNPTFGIIEFIPDNIPVIGNLDEIVEVLLLAWASYKGYHIVRQAMRPKPIAQDHQIDDVDYIDVNAEIVETPPSDKS